MSPIRPADFAEFFRSVNGFEPFPWQQRLADRVCVPDGAWPRCIALPTAAGKTACIDIAVFALAYQAALPPEKRTAPRRIFFVVDRRVIVDQAFDHANALSHKLTNADNDVLRRVASALRSLGASDKRPLDVYALRGGMYRESAWVRSPLQPTVITSTVDQVGSRLLFRGYGVSDASKPLHAALVGNDALILLDEAHCAKPFEQTMTLVRKYRDWCATPEDAPRSPFHFVTLTATPIERHDAAQTESLQADDRAHEVLGKRITASKPARLVLARAAKGAKWRNGLVKALADEAVQLRANGHAAVGVIVNRVATARDVAKTLRDAQPKKSDDQMDVVLLTGRMRPVDRDLLMEKISPLRSGSTPPEKPIVVVATQTLEVGADLDFDALVTECASLDALRQRFGRLNRLGSKASSEAVIVVRADQAAPETDHAKADPVYGNALAYTWMWLNERATTVANNQADANGVIDFGVDAMDRLTRDTPNEALAQCAAPAPDAATLLPAHLDMWCQTAPLPTPDPDPSPFLHGPQRRQPDVQIVLRADLGDDPGKWYDIASLCPPSSSESLSIPLRDFQRWLKRQDTDPDTTDVEGGGDDPSEHNRSNARDDDHSADAEPRRALRWRGHDSSESRIVTDADRLTPGDVYIVPITNDAQRAEAAMLGDFPTDQTGLPIFEDVGDRAHIRSRDRAFLRIRSDVYKELDSSINELSSEDSDDDEIQVAIQDALATLQSHPNEDVRRAADHLIHPRQRRIEFHPRGGLVVFGKQRLRWLDPTFIEQDEPWESPSLRPYPLDTHCRDVARCAERNAERVGMMQSHSRALRFAGLLHDVGKADPRFQAILRGNPVIARAAQNQHIAKSYGPPRSPSEQTRIRAQSGYPEGARHELLSVALALAAGSPLHELPDHEHDLVLHLIAAHHGRCRPFAPVAPDHDAVNVRYAIDGRTLEASSDHALERLDSGVAERFWSLTRRYGWWSLAYLEALLRLADWECVEPRSEDGSPQLTVAAPGRKVTTASASEATS